MSKRPTMTITDSFGATYEANHLSICKDGDGYSLVCQVDGVVHILPPGSITSIELAGFGDDVEGGSELSPWGHTMNKAVDGEQPVDLLLQLKEGLRSGRLVLTDTQAAVEPEAVVE